MKTPRDYGLNHDEWYPHQLDTIEWAENTEGTTIVEAPTGSGKTGFAKALMHKQKGIALVKTKFLQADNYERGYAFAPLYGKNNYDCIHPRAYPEATVDDCLFKTMVKCGVYEACHYVVKRIAAQTAQQAALNYAYWLNILPMIQREEGGWTPPKLLVCDEAHQLRNIVLEHAGTILSEEKRLDWELPMFPIIRSSNIGGKSALGAGSNAAELAGNWLSKSIGILTGKISAMEEQAKQNASVRKRLRAAERLAGKLKSTRVALLEAPEDWFIRSGPNAEKKVKELVCCPLTARFHFPKWFMSDEWKLVVMSATIGDEATFAASLGITGYNFKRVPSRFTPEQKPVFDLGVPRLGMKSTEADWNLQADKIAAAIKQCDPTWNGLIHTTSKFKASDLAKRLHSRGLQDRVYVAQEGTGTEQMVTAWHQRMNKHPGSLLISWALHEGYNGTREKININAKTPYPAQTTEYERVKRDYDVATYNAETAVMLEQQCGRVRRSPEDYDTDGQRNTFNALADGGYKWVVKYMSPDFRESITSL